MVTTNQKPITSRKKSKTKEIKHITKDSHQTTKKESKRQEQRRTTKTPPKKEKVTKWQ